MKLLTILVLLLVASAIGVYYLNQPSVSIETIPPQIICYGGGC